MEPLLLLSGCLPFLSELAGQICQSINGTCELRMTKLVIFPEQGQLGQKQFSVPKNSCFPFACWPIQLASCGKWYVSTVS